MESFITQFPYWLEGCQNLSELLVEIPFGSVSLFDRKRQLQGLMTRICNKVGVQGQLVRSFRGGGDVRAELWKWEAAAGTFMDWAQDLGMRWIDSSLRRQEKRRRWNFLACDNLERLGLRDN
jgi:hypothetical protein